MSFAVEMLQQYENSAKLIITSDSVLLKGVCLVCENELELIKLIRENDNPERALMVAATIILGYLKQHESSEEPVAVDLQALA